jgi:hypothetical protein
MLAPATKLTNFVVGAFRNCSDHVPIVQMKVWGTYLIQEDKMGRS